MFEHDKGECMSFYTKLILTISALLSPNVVMALDLDYYTYNGFTETVNAFTRIAVIFNDQEYIYMFAVAAVFGILFGGISFYGKQLVSGYQGNNFSLSWLLGIIIGAAVYQGLVIPKGTVHIYDPVRNDYQAVGNVPDLLILISGAWNKIERVAVEVVDASSAYPYANEVGGISFELLYNATTDYSGIDDYYLVKSIKKYYSDCSQMALVQPTYNFDLNQLRSGTNDLFTLLSQLRSPSDFTVYYSAANKAGLTVSCQDVWNNFLQPVLALDATYDGLLRTVCGKSGFNVNSANQLARCQASLARINTSVYDYNSGHIHLLRNAAIANAIAQSLQEENPDAGLKALTNRAVMTDGIGTSQAADEWLPTVRTAVFTIVLGLMPLLLCFLVTPLIWKSLFLIFGLFTWIALWGISDVIAHGIAMDQAIAAVEEIKRHNMGITAMMLSPESSLKALAIFGKARSMGITISTVLCAGLFGFSGYALSNIASTWQGAIDKEGTDAANRSNTPEGHSHQLRNLNESYATEFATAHYGHEGVSDSQALNQATDVARGGHMLNDLRANGTGTLNGANHLGAISGGGQIATMTVMQAMTARNGMNPNSSFDLGQMSQRVSEIDNLSRMGSSLSVDAAAREMGFNDVADMQQFTNYWDTMHSVGRNASLTNFKSAFEASTGKEMSDHEFMSMITRYETAPIKADVEVTGGNAGTYQDYLEKHQTMNFSKLDAQERVARMFGRSLDDLAWADGQFSAFSSIGGSNALDSMSPEDMVLGYMAQSIRTGASGSAWQNIAEDYEGGYRGLFKDIAEFDTVNDFGRMLSFSNAAEQMAVDKQHMAVAMHSSGMSFVVTPDDIPQLLDQGLIDQKMALALNRDGGGTVTASFDPKSGFGLSATTNSGVSMTANSSFSDLDYERIDSSRVDDRSVRVEAGVQTGANTVSTLLLNKEQDEFLEDHLRLIDNDVAARENFVLNAAGWLKGITSSGVTENYASTLEGNVGAGARGGMRWDSDKQAIGFLGKTISGVGFYGDTSAHIQGSKSWSGSDIESDTHSQEYQTMRSVFENSESVATRMAQQEVNRLADQQYKDTGSSMTFEEREQKLAELKYDYWADNLNNSVTTVLDDYKKANQDATENSEISERVGEKIEEINQKLEKDGK